MIAKQVIFMDEEGCVEGGILLDDMPNSQQVICGCCGGILDSDQYTILYEYPNWCNVSNEITGEDETINRLRKAVNDLSVDEVKEIFLGEKKLEVPEKIFEAMYF